MRSHADLPDSATPYMTALAPTRTSYPAPCQRQQQKKLETLAKRREKYGLGLRPPHGGLMRTVSVLLLFCTRGTYAYPLQASRRITATTIPTAVSCFLVSSSSSILRATAEEYQGDSTYDNDNGNDNDDDIADEDEEEEDEEEEWSDEEIERLLWSFASTLGIGAVVSWLVWRISAKTRKRKLAAAAQQQQQEGHEVVNPGRQTNEYPGLRHRRTTNTNTNTNSGTTAPPTDQAAAQASSSNSATSVQAKPVDGVLPFSYIRSLRRNLYNDPEQPQTTTTTSSSFLETELDTPANQRHVLKSLYQLALVTPFHAPPTVSSTSSSNSSSSSSSSNSQSSSLAKLASGGYTAIVAISPTQATHKNTLLFLRLLGGVTNLFVVLGYDTTAAADEDGKEEEEEEEQKEKDDNRKANPGEEPSSASTKEPKTQTQTQAQTQNEATLQKETQTLIQNMYTPPQNTTTTTTSSPQQQNNTPILHPAFLPQHRIVASQSTVGRIAFVRQLRPDLVLDFEEGVQQQLGRFGFRVLLYGVDDDDDGGGEESGSGSGSGSGSRSGSGRKRLKDFLPVDVVSCS